MSSDPRLLIPEVWMTAMNLAYAEELLRFVEGTIGDAHVVAWPSEAGSQMDEIDRIIEEAQS